MDVLNAAWTQVKQVWGGLNPGQRTLGLVLLGLLVAGLAGTALWTGQTEYVPLFSAPLESPDQVGNVLKVLKGADIPVRQDKGQILVPAASYDKAYIELTGKSAWPESQGMMELKGLSDDWKMSDGTRRERARLGLQGRLSRMLGMMQGVHSANVLLAEGNNSIFSGERHEAKATVQVVLRPQVEALSPGVAETIRRIVAYGVQGIKPSAVAVVDSLGRVYEEQPRDDDRAVMTDLEKLERGLEQDLIQKVRNALAPLAGSKIAVTADVVLDRSRQKTHERRVNPDEAIVKRERTESRNSSTPSQAVEGVPGVGSNLTTAAEQGVPAPPTTSMEEKSEIERDYTVKETETQKGAGELRQVTVGVLVPYAKGETEPDVKTIETYRGFVMKAAGITDPSFATVSAIAYEPVPVETVPGWRQALDLALAHADHLLLGILAVGALLLLGRALRLASPGPAAGSAPEVAGMAGAVQAIARARQGLEPLAEASPEAARNAELEARVREMVRKDPKISAGLVKRWLLTANK